MGDADCWCKHYYVAYQMKDVMFVYWLAVTRPARHYGNDNQQLLTARQAEPARGKLSVVL